MKKFTSEEIRGFVSKPLFTEKVILNKDSSWPKISIVTPSYNQAEFLERAILSVLNQNYPNLEYLIIDGGSTDGSVEVIKKYEKYLGYWVSEKDNGQSDAINKGFMKSTGEIIGWQNSDDIYLPEAFIKVIKIFKNFPKFDIVFGNTKIIDKRDQEIDEQRFTPFSIITHLYDCISANNQSFFWRKDLLRKIGLLDTRFKFSMDYEFFLRAAFKGARFKHIKSFLGAFRIHENTKTSLISNVSVEEHKIIDKLYKKTYLNEPFRLFSLLRRSFYYLIQGDLDYLLRGGKKKLGNLWHI